MERNDITSEKIRDCNDVNELKDMAQKLKAQCENKEDTIQSFKDTIPLILCLVGGFVGGRHARYSDETFWSALFSGVSSIFGIAVVSAIVGVALSVLAHSIKDRENKTAAFVLKILACVGLLVLGALLPFRWGW